MKNTKILSVLVALAMTVQGLAQLNQITPFVVSVCVSNDTATVVFGYHNDDEETIDVPHAPFLSNWIFTSPNTSFPATPPTFFFPGTHLLPPFSFHINQNTSVTWRIDLTENIETIASLTPGGSSSPALSVSDEDGNLLMEVNDNGTAGSITLPPIGGGVSCLAANTLSNLNGRLFFDGTDLMSQSLWGGTLNGDINSVNTGNVGIGTTPDTRLHLRGDDNNGTTATLKITSGSQSMLLDGNEIDSDGDLLLNNNSGTDVIIANGSSHVGIGISSPDTRLHLNGDDNNGTTATLKITSASQNMLLDGNEIDSDGDLFLNNNSGADIIMANGSSHVGIGTGSPTARLDVAAASGEPSIVTRGGFDYATVAGQFMSFGHWNGSTYDERFTITPSGNIMAPGITFGDHSNMQYRTSDGRFFYDNSSRRYKENITPLEDDFSLILKAQPKTYTRPGSPDRWEVGYIAEEMDSLGLARLVSYDAAGIPDGFNYEKMILYVTEILKEHDQRMAGMEALQNEVGLLGQQNRELRGDVDRLTYLLFGLLALVLAAFVFSKIKSHRRLVVRSTFLFIPLSIFTITTGHAQLHIQPGATVKTSGAAIVHLHDIDLHNEGVFDGSDGSTVVLKQQTGTAPQNVGGTGTTTFHNLHIERDSANAVLTGAFTIDSNLLLTSGLLDLNGHNITLSTDGRIVNETEDNHIIGPNGGVVQMTVDLNAPIAQNPGNLGFVITCAADLGSTLIQRGHVPMNTPQGDGILRHFKVTPTNNANLDATVRLYYLDAENPTIAEDSLEIWRQISGDWDLVLSDNKDSGFNWFEKSNVAHLSSWTLAHICPWASYFADADADGFGNPALLQQDCDQPLGYVGDNTDCDDSNGNIHPGAAEICNGLDDDCNGSPESTMNNWTGLGNGLNWSDPANWSDGLVPLPCQGILIPNGATVVVGASGAAVGKTLEVENGAELVADPAATMDIGNN